MERKYQVRKTVFRKSQKDWAKVEWEDVKDKDTIYCCQSSYYFI